MKSNEKLNIFILGALSLIGFFSNLGLRPVGLMEARNFISAREMLQNKEYLITTLNQNLRFEKPPLPTYLTAFIMKINGYTTNEFILRIPVAIFGVISIFFIYFIVKELTQNKKLSFLSGFIGLTTFMIIKIANENSWDFYTYAFALGGVLYFLRGLNKNKFYDFLISGAFLGFSFMSKGPVGIYALFLPFTVAYALVYGGKKYIKNIWKILGMIAISIVVGGLWWFLIYLRYGDILLNVMKKEEMSWVNSHVKSVFYYLDYFIYMGIWIIFALASYKRDFVNRISQDRKYSKFIFVWQILVILALSVVRMKKKRYGVPIFMVSALGVGDILYYFYTSKNFTKYERYLLNIQKYFIYIIWIFSISCIGFGIYGGILAWYMGIFYEVLGVLIMIFYLKKSSPKNLIIISGILFLFANITTGRVLSKSIIDKNIKIDGTKDIKLLRISPPKEEIFSQNFGIEDVWRVGKTIKEYKEGDTLPDEFLFFNTPPKDILKSFKIVDKTSYENERNEVVDIYLMKKESDN